MERAQGGDRWLRRQRSERFITPEDLLRGELLTEVILLKENGDTVWLPRALISYHYDQSYLPAATAEIWGHPNTQQALTAELARSANILSPMGWLSSNRSLCIWFQIPQSSLPWTIIRFPVLDSELCRVRGVSIILGVPFIRWYTAYYGLDRPQRQPQSQYVFNNRALAPNGGQQQSSGDRARMARMPLIVAEEEGDIDGGPDLGQDHEQF
ncbi:hypothetical protein B0T21DRAFT_138011 [Apiosordaria backusii]|uniref:Uncharacterized protein n=1 Tax=Apiosordaria backusii TaxID=314023 RepID=A0AA40EHL7_9PEZI|nr:hypothetical protein B0T21DRAFT_138011 [Apiosordaria backusii]